MSEYKEVSGSIDVPRNTGREGLLHTVREILRLPKVQEIRILKGQVHFRRYAREGETAEVDMGKISFDGLSPYHVIRNLETVVPVEAVVGANAASVIGHLFDNVGRDGLFPIAWVSGAATHFWMWHEFTAGTRLTSHQTVYGLPFLTDRSIEDDSLFLCAAYSRNAPLTDTERAYMVHMENDGNLTTVEIL